MRTDFEARIREEMLQLVDDNVRQATPLDLMDIVTKAEARIARRQAARALAVAVLIIAALLVIRSV